MVESDRWVRVGSEDEDSGGRSNLVVGGKDLVISSSIVGVTIPAVPHRLTLAATESACCLVSITGKKGDHTGTLTWSVLSKSSHGNTSIERFFCEISSHGNASIE